VLIGGLALGLAFGLVLGLVFTLLAWGTGWTGGLGFALIVGLAIGLIPAAIGGLILGLAWLIVAGMTWVRFRVVCWRLSHNDSLPSDPVRFLDEAADHVLLYRTGDGYLFIHPLLRDHLAEVPPPDAPATGPA
jgi:hypothetical protein